MATFGHLWIETAYLAEFKMLVLNFEEPVGEATCPDVKLLRIFLNLCPPDVWDYISHNPQSEWLWPTKMLSVDGGYCSMAHFVDTRFGKFLL